MRTKHIFFSVVLLAVVFSNVFAQPIKISQDKRHFAQSNGKPFLWLGDTAWLLLKKCTRDETIKYLDTRQQQGFNVVQVMVIHSLDEAKNAYGSAAVEGKDVSKTIVTPGNRFGVKDEYDYWDHLDWVVDQANRRRLQMALVPVWGSNVKSITPAQAEKYAAFLAERFKDKPNIIWLNGGDIRGSEGMDVWQTIGKTLRAKEPNHLITFHPRGRYSSTDWFHNEPWLDFNMFQSGHRNYAQDNDPKEPHRFGEDNWRYAVADRAMSPTKPTLDGEPSYENIPQGLHDAKQPRWDAAAIRRYAYWSVFAGGAGFTYGENSVMQFYKKTDKSAPYGAEKEWLETINAPGAKQMRFVKELMMSRPLFENAPAQEMVVDQGERYRYVAAIKGKRHAFLYTYTGRNIHVKMGILPGVKLKAQWFNPRDGKYMSIKNVENKGVQIFDPPGDEKEGNDWVLVLTGN